jgi:hypothetical protein
MMQFAVSDYSIAVPSSSVTVNAGQTAVFNLTVAPLNGTFASSVDFTAAPLPPGASASFSPSATITPGSSGQTVTLSIATTAHSVSLLQTLRTNGGRILFFVSLAALGIAVGGLFKSGWKAAHIGAKPLAPRFLTLLLLVGALGMAACTVSGGGPSAVPQVNTSTGTPAGTYTFKVTATSGGSAHTVSATITVI